MRLAEGIEENSSHNRRKSRSTYSSVRYMLLAASRVMLLTWCNSTLPLGWLRPSEREDLTRGRMMVTLVGVGLDMRRC